MSERKIKLKSQIERTVFDFNNPDACKINPLKDKNIIELSLEDQKKYGKFKIHKREVVYVRLESYINYYLYVENADKEWELINIFEVYRKEYEKIPWGGYTERQKSPPIPEIYVDIEDFIYYIEDENDAFYCTLDIHQNWWYHNEPPEKRPYHNRIDKLRKFTIPYSEEFISDKEN